MTFHAYYVSYMFGCNVLVNSQRIAAKNQWHKRQVLQANNVCCSSRQFARHNRHVILFLYIIHSKQTATRFWQFVIVSFWQIILFHSLTSLGCFHFVIQIQRKDTDKEWETHSIINSRCKWKDHGLAVCLVHHVISLGILQSSFPFCFRGRSFFSGLFPCLPVLLPGTRSLSISSPSSSSRARLPLVEWLLLPMNGERKEYKCLRFSYGFDLMFVLEFPFPFPLHDHPFAHFMRILFDFHLILPRSLSWKEARSHVVLSAVSFYSSILYDLKYCCCWEFRVRVAVFVVWAVPPDAVMMEGYIMPSLESSIWTWLWWARKWTWGCEDEVVVPDEAAEEDDVVTDVTPVVGEPL